MIEKKGINRRQFMKNSALGVMGVSLAGKNIKLDAAEDSTPSLGKIKSFRPLGKTGFKISDVSLGGVSNVEVIKAMLEAGVNYIDTAESYSRGKSEISMGQAIKSFKR